jgi:hypothetical protein
MPAQPGDIAAASREAAVARWDGAAVASRYPSAIDGAKAPSAGFFDAAADAQTTVEARALLLGVERRRFTATAHDVAFPAISTAIPTIALTDGEQGAAALPCLVARIEIDLEAETTTYELFG